ncbi:hypothetical protein [Paracoccus sp. ME4]|uniref:hypothetical protein n=1 Tax=Paracoccus sp. ME4 TaxID=3138066 RepID=UPI00398AB31D
MSNNRYPHKGANGALPETVVTALISASDEVSRNESWTAPRRGGASAVVPRVMSVIAAAQAGLRDGPARSFVRQNSLRILAYLPADLRLSALIEMASKHPEAIDDLFTGKITKPFEVYRYNIISSLGVFARHGLVEEVFTRDRIERVTGTIKSVQQRSTKR